MKKKYAKYCARIDESTEYVTPLLNIMDRVSFN